jgi:hypothetical protein
VKFGVSDEEIEEIRTLVEPLRKVSGAKTAERVAKLSDEMFESYLSATKEPSRRKAIRRLWELEEWLIGKS